MSVSHLKETLPDGYKRCTKCNEVKLHAEFHINAKGRENNIDGLVSRCKKCYLIKQREYHKNPANKEKILEWRKKYNATTGKKYYLEHRENKLIARAKWYKENKEKAIERAKKWKQENKNNPKYKLNDSISAAIRKALRRNKNGYHWEKLVGYTLEDLMKHLEKLFIAGMTWENYGRNGWSIDHIIPI